MSFTGLTFLLVFLPITLLLYFVAGVNVRPWVLLCANLFFYALGQMDFMVILCLLTVINTYIAIVLGHLNVKKVRGLLLIIGIAGNMCLLAYYKYSGEHLLPIGLSFYTFKAVSVIVDSYKGKVSIKTPIDVMNYLLFFGQIQSGPISRFEVEDSFNTREGLSLTNFSKGVEYFLLGFSKKILIADVLVKITDEVFASKNLSVPYTWLGAVCFSLQLYYDFSGYSDMAIGMGAILGFHFPENFNYPYMAKSVTDFWRRWHISLSSWFREYVYIPLGGNRRGMPRQLFNILIVWMLTGIWHGAGWNFLLWGLWFALWLILEKLVLGRVLKVLPSMVGRLYTWLVVLVSWVFFAIESGNGAMNYLYVMFGQGAAGLYDSATLFTLLEYRVLLLFAALAATPLAHRLSEAFFRSTGSGVVAVRRVAEKLVLSLLLLASIAYIVEASYNPFLYFRF